MSYAVRVLCRPEVAAGFGLAGLRCDEVDAAGDGAPRLRGLMAERGTGVVLVEDRLYESLPEDLRRQMGRRPLPMVVPFPGPTWAARPDAAEEYIVELLRQVIGYRVRLR
jgi:vacuolar-type H+-ATPase subunit F/Vma7